MTTALKGLCILNTRPKGQAASLSAAIQKLGGTVIECPTIEIKETNNWLQHLPTLAFASRAIFTSPNAVFFAFKVLRQNNIDWPSTLYTIAIGAGTASALQQQGIHIAEIPAQADSEHLIQLRSLNAPLNGTVLLFKGVGGREVLQEHLSNIQDCELHIIEVYERYLPHYEPKLMRSIWQEQQVDIILLTSEQSLMNLFELFGKEASTWLRSKTCLVISERLKKAALAHGFTQVILSTPEHIVETLERHYQGFIHGKK